MNQDNKNVTKRQAKQAGKVRLLSADERGRAAPWHG
jgi:hypothetical protein